MSFLKYYFGLEESSKEQLVCCPFEHSTVSGVKYLETHPSAHVNLVENLFHCKACGTGHSDQMFLRAMLGTSPANTARLAKLFEGTADRYEWRKEPPLSPELIQKANDLGISDAVLEELEVKADAEKSLCFPVFIHDKLVDIRSYNRSRTPKCKSQLGAVAGLVIPYDLWRQTPKHRWTLLCAGEKDMAVARSHGLNAITLTGGENMLPSITTEFKDRRIAIVYDNDEPGKKGAIKMANFLFPLAKEIRVVTGFHEICKENKEDITDFFVKYEGTKDQLTRYIQATPTYTPPPDEKNLAPLVDLHTAAKPENLHRTLRANVQVVAMSDGAYPSPAAFMATKMRCDGKDDQMFEKEVREWTLTEDNCADILHLIDNNFTEDDIQLNQRALLGILRKERYVAFKTLSQVTVHKGIVTDMFETTQLDVIPMEFEVYSIGVRLESGKKYLVTFRLVPHPYKGQKLLMIVTKATDPNDSVTSFQLTDETKARLDVFRRMTGTPTERMQELSDRFKGLLGYNGNTTLIQAMDLAFHTVLYFHYNKNFPNVRGYLDTLIVGESRMGKSSTADMMRKTYELGVFTSLAGNSATIPGLVGGSNKTQTGFQTRAGLIPQNHRGLIIFEEFGKCKNDVVQELTDIRSSNEVRITRVSGTIVLPATVRMISLTNVKADEGNIKPIAAYPNGIEIVKELVPTAEDIARYDLMVVLGDRGSKFVDPGWTPPLAAFPLDAYRTRIRWVWSRKPDHIRFAPGTHERLVETSNKLNETFDCHIKIFGTEAWKKLLRLAIACAGCLVSTDDDYEHIIVLPEHIDFAAEFMMRVYDNGTFRLKEYVEHEKKYSTIDDGGVALLQDVFAKSPALLLQLEQSSKTTKNTLQAATGLTNDEYNTLMNRLVTNLFVTFTKFEVVPTERFRLGMARIDRHMKARKVGEVEI